MAAERTRRRDDPDDDLESESVSRQWIRRRSAVPESSGWPVGRGWRRGGGAGARSPSQSLRRSCLIMNEAGPWASSLAQPSRVKTLVSSACRPPAAPPAAPPRPAPPRLASRGPARPTGAASPPTGTESPTRTRAPLHCHPARARSEFAGRPVSRPPLASRCASESAPRPTRTLAPQPALRLKRTEPARGRRQRRCTALPPSDLRVPPFPTAPAPLSPSLPSLFESEPHALRVPAGQPGVQPADPSLPTSPPAVPDPRLQHAGLAGTGRLRRPDSDGTDSGRCRPQAEGGVCVRQDSGEDDVTVGRGAPRPTGGGWGWRTTGG